MRIVRYFAVRRSKMKGSIPNKTMEQALSNLLFNDDAQWFKWYDLVRNYLTKKPQDDVKENTLKLNFDSSSFLKESGWDKDYSKNGAFIVIRDNNYYLVVIKNKLEEDDLNKINTSHGSNAQKIIHNYQKMDFKNFPRWFIMSTGNQVAKTVTKYNLPVDTILDEYKRYRELSPNGRKKYMDGHPRFLIKLIDYYKKCAPLHESLAPFKDRLEAVWRKTEEYMSLSDFYNDTLSVCYDIKFENINFEALLSSDKFFLFRICNKDFSSGKNGGNGTTGKENLHTIYWKMLFDKSNLKDVIFKLDGQGAEIFMRKPVAKDSPVKHEVGSKLVNKRDIDGNTIPENLYREIYLYENGIKKKISPEAKKYIDERRTVVKEAKHEIIKDNRFYGETRYLFHCPITINFKAKSYKEPKYAFSEVNEIITNSLRKSDELQFIGIDRGERHLLYVSVIDSRGRIKEQFSLNQIINEYKGNSYSTDYHKLLEERDEKRAKERQSWDSIESIKELKQGYLSQVIHKIASLVVKYNAVVVLEDLNIGFKRGRQKVESSIYQQFEKALIDKFNYLVDKNVAPKQPGGLMKGYQLTNKFSSFRDMGKQNGFLFYIPAWNTSKIDPVTGFVDMLHPKYESVEKAREFFTKFNKISYNQEKGWFEFLFDYNDFTTKAEGTRTVWTLCTFGKRIETFRNKNKNSMWDNKEIDLTSAFISLCEKYNVPLSCDMKNDIIVQIEKDFF